jgi:hypothetical protein
MASFQPRLCASSIPEFRPRTPKIGTKWAASPANSTRAVPVAVERQAVGAVNRLPQQAPRRAHAHGAELRPQPRRHVLVAQRLVGVLASRSWMSMRQTPSGLHVEDHGGARVGGRSN